ncbi:MAG TPA: hypothetical protein VNR36_01525 [Pseudolysinimonas sp.]|nr:hypothetical protein [Pseudolysinimonas sp.]
MNEFLPSDAEVARRLADVRVAVLEATAQVRSPKRSTRYRVTRNLIIAGVAVAALTAGAVVIALETQDVRSTNVICFEEAGVESRQVAGGTSADMFDPIEMCSAIWAVDGFADPDGQDYTHPVPDLVACTMPNGIAGVFPLGDARPEDFCAALGLADWDSD